MNRIWKILGDQGRRRLEAGLKPPFRWYHKLAFFRESKQFDIYDQMPSFPWGWLLISLILLVSKLPVSKRRRRENRQVVKFTEF